MLKHWALMRRKQDCLSHIVTLVKMLLKAIPSSILELLPLLIRTSQGSNNECFQETPPRVKGFHRRCKALPLMEGDAALGLRAEQEVYWFVCTEPRRRWRAGDFEEWRTWKVHPLWRSPELCRSKNFLIEQKVDHPCQSRPRLLARDGASAHASITSFKACEEFRATEPSWAWELIATVLSIAN